MKKYVSNSVTPEELMYQFRMSVLTALDKRVFRTYGIKHAGWRAGELESLFSALDQHAKVTSARLEKTLAEKP